MRRFIGILLIVRGFSPILLVLVVVWALGQMLGDLNIAIETPLTNIQAEIDLLETDIAVVYTNFQAVEANISEIQQILESVDLANLLPDFSGLGVFDDLNLNGISINNFTIPIPDDVDVTWKTASVNVQVVEEILEDCGVFQFACDGISTVVRTVTRTARYPDITVSTSNFTVNVPALPTIPTIPFPSVFEDIANELTSMFDVFTDIFTTMDPIFDSFTTLGTTLEELPNDLSGIVQESENLFNILKSFFTNWSSAIAVALVLIGILFAINFIVPLLDDIRRGLKIVISGSPTDSDEAVADNT